MHFFLINFKTCTKASWHPLHPDPVFEHCLASKLPVSNRTFLLETEKKGSVHCTNQTWDILTCKVLQDSQRILPLAPIKMQLPVHNLPKTHHFPPAFHQCSHKAQATSPSTLHRVRLRTANLHTTSSLWCPLNNCISESGKQHFCAPTLHGVTFRGKGSTGHKCHFPLCLHLPNLPNPSIKMEKFISQAMKWVSQVRPSSTEIQDASQRKPAGNLQGKGGKLIASSQQETAARTSVTP